VAIQSEGNSLATGSAGRKIVTMDSFVNLYSFNTIAMIVFAIIYYKAAQIENTSALLWVGLSIIVSLAITIVGFGLLALIIGQVLLYLAITLVRLLASKRK